MDFSVTYIVAQAVFGALLALHGYETVACAVFCEWILFRHLLWQKLEPVFRSSSLASVPL